MYSNSKLNGRTLFVDDIKNVRFIGKVKTCGETTQVTCTYTRARAILTSADIVPFAATSDVHARVA